jgi:hypothetical protein
MHAKAFSEKISTGDESHSRFFASFIDPTPDLSTVSYVLAQNIYFSDLFFALRVFAAGK